jgi:apolipoprotein N-acyltransferase
MLFYTLKHFKWVRVGSIGLVTLLPIVFSFIILRNLPEHYDTKEIVVVQPNIDPYKKFVGGDQREQISTFLSLAETAISPNTELLVFPETFLAEHLNEEGISRIAAIRELTNFCNTYSHLKILTGASTHRFYKDGEKRAATVRTTNSGYEYESYNTALLVGPDGVEDIYHKSKLVPGVEKMPYPEVLGFLEKLNIDLGGISGSLAIADEAKVFGSYSFFYAPMICYESVFPDYVNQFVLKGSNLLFVITNDGWWRETDGHRQHKDYARLRAIENRREVLRSANTGISCRIDVAGNVYQETNWWEMDVIKVEAKLYNGTTLFSRTGDGFGRVASFIAVLALLSVLVKTFTRKKKLV